MARLKEIYRKEIAPKLKEELKLANVMEVPRVTKITLNMGLGEAIGDKKVIEHAVADMEKITGQKIPVIEKSRRPGDPPRLVASAEKARRELAWTPKYPKLDDIIRIKRYLGRPKDRESLLQLEAIKRLREQEGLR